MWKNDDDGKSQRKKVGESTYRKEEGSRSHGAQNPLWSEYFDIQSFALSHHFLQYISETVWAESNRGRGIRILRRNRGIGGRKLLGVSGHNVRVCGSDIAADVVVSLFENAANSGRPVSLNQAGLRQTPRMNAAQSIWPKNAAKRCRNAHADDFRSKFLF